MKRHENRNKRAAARQQGPGRAAAAARPLEVAEAAPQPPDGAGTPTSTLSRRLQRAVSESANYVTPAEVTEGFQQDLRQLCSLWEELGIPFGESQPLVDRHFAQPTEFNRWSVREEIKRLVEYRHHTKEVLKLIATREGLLEQIQALIARYDPAASAVRPVLNALLGLLDKLRRSTVDCSEAILRWKATAEQARPTFEGAVCFLWQGMDYSHKQLSDLNFLAACPLTQYLPYRILNNPFLDPDLPPYPDPPSAAEEAELSRSPLPPLRLQPLPACEGPASDALDVPQPSVESLDGQMDSDSSRRLSSAPPTERGPPPDPLPDPVTPRSHLEPPTANGTCGAAGNALAGCILVRLLLPAELFHVRAFLLLVAAALKVDPWELEVVRLLTDGIVVFRFPGCDGPCHRDRFLRTIQAGHPALAPLYIAHAVALQDDVERPLSEAVTYGRPAVPGRASPSDGPVAEDVANFASSSAMQCSHYRVSHLNQVVETLEAAPVTARRLKGLVVDELKALLAQLCPAESPSQTSRGSQQSASTPDSRSRPSPLLRWRKPGRRTGPDHSRGSSKSFTGVVPEAPGLTAANLSSADGRPLLPLPQRGWVPTGWQRRYWQEQALQDSLWAAPDLQRAQAEVQQWRHAAACTVQAAYREWRPKTSRGRTSPTAAVPTVLAAQDIQRVYRGYVGRFRVRCIREQRELAAIDIQRIARGCSARRAADRRRKRCNTAAVEVQRVWRGHRVRHAMAAAGDGPGEPPPPVGSPQRPPSPGPAPQPQNTTETPAGVLARPHSPPAPALPPAPVPLSPEDAESAVLLLQASCREWLAQCTAAARRTVLAAITQAPAGVGRAALEVAVAVSPKRAATSPPAPSPPQPDDFLRRPPVITVCPATPLVHSPASSPLLPPDGPPAHTPSPLPTAAEAPAAPAPAPADPAGGAEGAAEAEAEAEGRVGGAALRAWEAVGLSTAWLRPQSLAGEGEGEVLVVMPGNEADEAWRAYRAGRGSILCNVPGPVADPSSPQFSTDSAEGVRCTSMAAALLAAATAAEAAAGPGPDDVATSSPKPPPAAPPAGAPTDPEPDEADPVGDPESATAPSPPAGGSPLTAVALCAMEMEAEAAAQAGSPLTTPGLDFMLAAVAGAAAAPAAPAAPTAFPSLALLRTVLVEAKAAAHLEAVCSAARAAPAGPVRGPAPATSLLLDAVVRARPGEDARSLRTLLGVLTHTPDYATPREQRRRAAAGLAARPARPNPLLAPLQPAGPPDAAPNSVLAALPRR